MRARRGLRVAVRAEPGGVLAGRGTEQAAVLAVELRGAAVADEVSGTSHVGGPGDQKTKLNKSKLLAQKVLTKLG